jgi:hypothetical protein
VREEPDSRCVYCSSHANSQEDWFPRWLGRYRGVERLRDRLCTDCNEELGRTVDQSMSRESVEALNRYVHQIEGRHGEAPADVFSYKSQAPEPPIVVNAPHEGLPFKPLQEAMPGTDPPTLRTQRQLAFHRPDGSFDLIRMPDGMTGEWLRGAIERRQLVDAKLTHAICEPEDPSIQIAEFDLPGWVRRALLYALPGVREHVKSNGIGVYWLTKDMVAENVRSELRITLPLEYARAIAKIAFHYVLKTDPHMSGHEEAFKPIREFIRHGVGNHQDFVDLNGRPFVADPGYQFRGIHHFLFVESDREHLIKVRLQFFVKGMYRAAPIVVTIGRDAFTRDTRFGHAIRVYDVPVDRFNGELIPLETVRIDGLWGVVPPPWASDSR